MTIKDNQNHTEQALERLPDQFIDSTNLISLVSLGSDRMQGINDEAIKMLDGMSLSTASGKQLDNLATILNLVRIVGESDTDFRARIFSETAILAKSGEPSHVIDVYLLLTEASQVFFGENFPAGIELAAHATPDENLFTFSEDFSGWGKVGVSVVSDAIISDDGVKFADKVVCDTSTGAHRINHASITVDESTKTFTMSAKVHEAGYDFVALLAFSSADGFFINALLDLSDGSIASGTGAVIDLGGGWYRVSASGVLTDTLFQAFYESRETTSSSFTGDGSSGFYITEAQMSQTDDAIDYVKTEATPVLITDNDEAIINSMTNVKAGGIDMILLLSPETDFFFFDSEANVDASGDGTSDSSGGFGSTLDVDGGQLSRVLI